MPQTVTASITDPSETQEIWKILENNSTNLTVSEGGVVVVADALVGQVSINLPAAADNVDRVIMVKKVDGTSNNVVVDPNGSETIDGATSYTLSTQYQAVSIISDGTEWHIV